MVEEKTVEVFLVDHASSSAKGFKFDFSRSDDSCWIFKNTYLRESLSNLAFNSLKRCLFLKQILKVFKLLGE